MIFLSAAGIGAILGWFVALRRGGAMLDKLQYMAIFALVFTVVGLFLAIGLDRIN